MNPESIIRTLNLYSESQYQFMNHNTNDECQFMNACSYSEYECQFIFRS